MALEASTYEKNAIANAVFGGVSYPDAVTFTLKLFSDTVSLAGVGTEITTAGYADKDIPNNLANFPLTTTGEKENALQIDMDPLTADSPEIVSAGLFDEDGNLRYRKVFAVPFVIENGQFYSLAAGDLTLSIS
jgi:hypothetical protein